MKEQQTIARITRDAFKQRERKFSKISGLEQEKKRHIELLNQRQCCIDVHLNFYNTCQQLSYKELLAHPHVGVLLSNGLIKIYEMRNSSKQSEESYDEIASRIFLIPITENYISDN